MRKINYLLCLALAIFFSNAAVAQVETDIPFDDLPPTNEYGKCYAKCKIPDVYETVDVQKVVKEASTKLIKVPAVYETVTERIMTKEGSTKYRTIPATFKTVTEQVMVMPEKSIIKTIPAKYETRTRQVLETPERGKWVKKKKSPNCFSQNPEDCYVACYELIPAKYRTESYQVLVEPARTTEEIIPAKYKTVTKKVVDQPARVEEIPVEAVYKDVPKKVLVSPETTREEVIPSVTKTFKEKRLVKQGGYTVWTEILCAEKTTSSKVRAVQNALNAAGYNCGAADGVMGINTTNALRKYQNDKGLPVGNLNIETLKALGITNY